MSNIPKILKRMVLPVAFVTISSYLPVVNANTIRIVGPESEDSSYAALNRDATTGQLTIPTQQFSTSSSMARNYGPTYENETLWGIASRHLPNKNVSIFKVIGAIYNLNRDAFENNNIHSLLPGSYLKLPTMDQIQQQRVSSVSRKLAADQLRAPYATELEKRRVAEEQLAKQQAAAAKTPRVIKLSPKPSLTSAQIIPNSTPKSDNDAKVASIKAEDVATATTVKDAVLTNVVTSDANGEVSEDNTAVIPPKPQQPQVDVTDVKMNALVESNHALRLRLSAMQQDMDALKDQITESDSIRQKMVSFLEQQQPQQLEAPVATTWLERFTSNPWALAAAGIIPGGLIAALVALLFFRRNKDEPQQSSLPAPTTDDNDNTIAAVPPIDFVGNDHNDDLDDLFSDDDLFADIEPNQLDKKQDTVIAQTTEVVNTAETEVSQAGSATTAIDFDDSEFDNNFGSISVSNDDAIGLEDMERALDEFDAKPELSADEELAALWEKSLNEEDNANFDLSEYDETTSSSVALVAAENSETDTEKPLSDQALLDEILQQAQASSSDAEKSEAELEGTTVVSQDELDALFTQFNHDLPDITATTTPTETNDSDSLFAENSIELLDDLVADDDAKSLDSEIELAENSTALLDELLADESDEQAATSNIKLDENSTDLLDELLAADPATTAFNLDDLPEFDEQAAFDHYDDEMSALPAADAVHNAPLSLDDLPEFDETSAFDDPQASPLEQMDDRSEIDEQVAIDNVTRQLQQAAQAAEQRQPAPVEASATTAESEYSPFDTARHLEYAFDNIDVSTLPEFDENEALFASFEEQHELEQYALECGFKSQAGADDAVEVDQSPEAKQDRVDSAGLDMDALLFDDADITEVTPQRGLNNDERDQLLATTVDSDLADNEDVLAEDEAAVWKGVAAEPELVSEDWSKQPDLAQADIKTATSTLSNYISIDELLADDPNYHQDDPDEKPLNLDVGLKDFPDMFANIRQFDVDSAGEYAGQLDLAKAYLEMNDIGGAVDLLQDIVLKGDGETKAEANALLDKFKTKK
ncbi:FimV/HubP family polar landmark protein [Photobacterium piscicola]|uniref:FimV/HubP family polar landmark protein n=1 Tax=Photobacterium piscicola TaxID=1378299 RepID=UPI002E17F31F|nr:FimV/HubP family polar landmark protein [Photobacterium piscicola]